MAAKCKICKKSVYPMDPQINLDGSIFHKPCAKCGDCNCQITLSNFTKNESTDQTLLLCKIHYFKRFHEGGSYVGGDKYQKAATRDVNSGVAAATGATKRPSYTAASSTSVPETETVFRKLKVTEKTPEKAPAETVQEPVAVPEPVAAQEPEPVAVSEPEPVADPVPVSAPVSVAVDAEVTTTETPVEDVAPAATTTEVDEKIIEETVSASEPVAEVTKEPTQADIETVAEDAQTPAAEETVSQEAEILDEY